MRQGCCSVIFKSNKMLTNQKLYAEAVDILVTIYLYCSV